MDLYRLARKIATVMNIPELFKKIRAEQNDGPGVMIPDDVRRLIIERPENIIRCEWIESGLLLQWRGDPQPIFFPMFGGKNK